MPVEPAQNPTSSPQVDLDGLSKPSISLVLAVFAALLLGIVGGFFGGQKLAVQKQGVQDSQISESELPIGASLLKNPIVNQWRGAFEGTLIAKSDDSVTIQDKNGNSLTIPLDVSPGPPINAKFFDFTAEATAAGRRELISFSLDNIAIGAYLRGDFFVIPGQKDTIVGGVFEMIEKPQ